MLNTLKNRPHKRANLKIYKPLERPAVRSVKKKKVLKILILLLLTSLISFLLFSPYFKVYNIEFQRDDISIDPTEIISALSILKWKHILLFNLSKVENSMQSRFSRFSNISISRKLPDTLILNVESFQDAFLINSFFTKENKQTKLKEKYIQKFYISQGWEVKWTDSEAKKQLYTINLKEGNIEFKPWDNALDPNLIHKIQNLIDKLNNKYWLKILNIDLYIKWREIRVEIEKWILWITLTKKFDDQLNKIELFEQNYWKDKKFNYLDLRINWKIIFKE